MNNAFRFYLEQEEGMPENTELKLTALETVLGRFIQSDTPTAAEVVFVEAEEIKKLNREQRNVDSVTDVLSFPSLDGILGKVLKKEDFPYEIDDEGNLFLGSIVICRQRAREQAEQFGHSYERELHYLLVHGVMHCLGYDHIEEEERAQMRKAEEAVLRQIGVTRDEV